MLAQPQTKLPSLKQIDKSRPKPTQKNPPKAKSHIIFAGDPAFQQQSYDYIPVCRRKKIFEDNQSKILPPDLLMDQDASMQHNRIPTNQRSISQNIGNSFDKEQAYRQGVSHYSAHQQTRRPKSNNLKEETYFEPNNIEADVNFGIIQEEEHNPAFNSSKASQTTQKKGGVAFFSQGPNANNFQGAASTLSTGRLPTTSPAINFSYQGKQFPKGEVMQSQVQKRIIPRSTHISPPKSNARTIFLNQGGVMVPKSKKITLQDSNYFDFQGGDNQSYHEYNPMVNGWANAIESQAIKHGETPEFNKFTNGNNVLSNELINQSLINQFNKMEFDPHMNNQNNNSAISYKSVQKQFQPEKQKPTDLNDKMPVPKPEESIVVKLLDQIGNPSLTKNDHSQSMSLLEQKQSMFDQLLKDRQKIFNKNKIQHEPQLPSPSLQKRISDNAIKRPNNTSVKNVTNEATTNEMIRSITKPVDFITDAHSVPKGVKRNIGISNVAGNEYEKVKHAYQQENIKNQNTLIESKVKKLEVNRRQQQSNNQVNEVKHQVQTQKNSSHISRKNSKPMQISKKQTNKSKFASQSQPINPLDEQQDKYSQQQQDLINESSSLSSSSSSSSQSQRASKKRRKRDRILRRSSKNKKTKLQNDSQLEEFLQKEKQNIHFKQIKKYMQHVPVIKDALNKRKKSKGKLGKGNYEPVIEDDSWKNPPVVVNNLQALTPQQRELLLSTGFKLISSSQAAISAMNNPPPNSNKNTPPNNINQQFPQGLMNNLINQTITNQPQGLYMSQQNQLNKKNNVNQLAGGMMSMVSGLKKKQTISQHKQHLQTAHYKHHHHHQFNTNNSQWMEHRFDEINKALYNELTKLLPMSSSTHSTNNIQPTTQLGSTISFGNHLTPSPNKINLPPTTTINPNHVQFVPSAQHLLQDESIQVNISSPKRHNHNHHGNKSQRQDEKLYSLKIYNELKRFNQQDHRYQDRNSYPMSVSYPATNDHNRRSHSKQKNRNHLDSVSDESHYYSFYHQDNPQTINIINEYPPRSHPLNTDPRSYYPLKSLKPFPPQKDNPSLKSRYDIRSTKFPSSQLQVLYKKLQQLTQQLREQLPLIRQQMQQNQQEIRKLQTNLLIRNTAQQHHLVRILQKMKIKDTQLKQKQLQVHHKDQELSMYQDEIDCLRNQFFQRKQMAKEMEMENFFQNRLQKIRNYNENLCSKIAQAKVVSKKATTSII